MTSFLKTKIALTSLLTLFSFTSNAQLLWKISGNELKKPSYLFGTHHTVNVDFCKEINGFNKAFNSCKQFYGELVMDSMNMPASQLKMVKYMMLPKGQQLEDLLTTEEFEQLNKLTLKYMSLPAQQLNRMTPMAVSAQLAMAVNGRIFEGFNANKQIDGQLQELAKKKKKDVFGLESIEFQLETMFNAPLEEQVEMLTSTITSDSLLEDQCKKLAQSYLSQDIESLMNIMYNSEDLDEKMLDKMLFNRNENWAAQLKTILQEKSTFIAVGAGHLPGERGMIKLLRKAGFTVEAVK